MAVKLNKYGKGTLYDKSYNTDIYNLTDVVEAINMGKMGNQKLILNQPPN